MVHQEIFAQIREFMCYGSSFATCEKLVLEMAVRTQWNYAILTLIFTKERKKSHESA